jgi:hypothetical protein
LFFEKSGPGFEPVFGPEIPARKLGLTSFSRAATASVGGVVGPISGPEPGPIFFEIPWFPGNFEGLQCAGGVRIPFLTLGRSWMGCLGGPTFRYLCVETARAVAWISPVWGQWGSRAGGLKARFGSAGRGGGGFTKTRTFFEGRLVRNGPEGNQMVSRFSVCACASSAPLR